MSSSRDQDDSVGDRPPSLAGDPVLRGDRAGVILAARFDVDLRQRGVLPPSVSAELRAEAHSSGYAAGWAQGRHAAEQAARVDADAVAVAAREAAARYAAVAERAIGALAAAATSLEQRAIPAGAELEDTIVASAFAIAQAVIGRELTSATEPGADALARALGLAAPNRPVTVRLSPPDVAMITGGDGGPREIDGRTVTLVADPTVAPGDAVAQCDATAIDARIAPAIDRVRAALGL